MLLRQLQTLVPDLALLINAAELALQDDVEVVDMFLGPLDAGGHEGLGKAGLEGGDSVFDEEEVDVRDLEDVGWVGAFECALSVPLLARILGEMTKRVGLVGRRTVTVS